MSSVSYVGLLFINSGHLMEINYYNSRFMIIDGEGGGFRIINNIL